MHDATDTLRREHVTIMVMVHVLEEMLARYDAGVKQTERDMPGVANFFLRYADRLHHGKEEHVLFPAILRRDAEMLPLLDELLEDHQRGRAILAEIDRAVLKADRDAYFDNVADYTRFIRQHIKRENEVLFPTADLLLSDDEQHELADLLTMVQEERMTGQELDDWSAYRTQLAQRYLKRDVVK